MILSVISWAIFGGLCGWIASILVKTVENEQTKQLVGLGVVAGIIGGFIGTSIIPGVGPDDLGGSSMMAVGAAIGFLWVKIYMESYGSKDRMSGSNMTSRRLQTSGTEQSDRRQDSGEGREANK